MTQASNYLENEIFDHVYRNAAFTSPATVYVALFTTTATTGELEAGTLTNEVSGGAYARQTITFTAPTDGSGSNNAAVTFPTATANWGTLRYAAYMDASTAGNVLSYLQLNSDVTVNNGNQLQFNTSSLTATVS